jgi:hypothetical protein
VVEELPVIAPMSMGVLIEIAGGVTALVNVAQLDEIETEKLGVKLGVNAAPLANSKVARTSAHSSSHLSRQAIDGSLMTSETTNGLTVVVVGTIELAPSAVAKVAATPEVDPVVSAVSNAPKVAKGVPVKIAAKKAVREAGNAAARTALQPARGASKSPMTSDARVVSTPEGRAPTTPL